MQEKAPTSRRYMHDRCKRETVVSDSAFSNMASPLSDISQTYCNNCKGMFQVQEFAWSDTLENLVDYRKRLAGHAGPISRFLCSKNAVIAMLVLGILLGIVSTQLMFPIQEGLFRFLILAFGISVIWLIALGSVLISVVTPLVHKWVCGVSDPRILQ